MTGNVGKLGGWACVAACPLGLFHFGPIERLREQYGGNADLVGAYRTLSNLASSWLGREVRLAGGLFACARIGQKFAGIGY